MTPLQQEIRDMIEGGRHLVPSYMWAGIERYMLQRGEPGSFLHALFCNDLMEACGRADDTNLANIPNYAVFLYNYAPSQSYGSKEKVAAWLKGEL